MERLTTRNKRGEVDVIVPDNGLKAEISALRVALDRLATYEDTGLSPEEIKEVQEAMDPIPFGRFHDIMEAERAGRLVLPSEPNDPLTLEELREMDGEPVWVRSINDDALFAPKGWAIVTALDNGDISLSFLGEDACRQTWVLSESSDEGADEEDEIKAVYRRKPKV